MILMVPVDLYLKFGTGYDLKVRSIGLTLRNGQNCGATVHAHVTELCEYVLFYVIICHVLSSLCCSVSLAYIWSSCDP